MSLLRRALLVAACVALVGAPPASAAVIYEFSLPANGEVGAFSVQLTFDDFLPEAGLVVFSLAEPVVTGFSSGTPIDADASAIGIDVLGGTTLFGVALFSPTELVLLTPASPDDFFPFSRTPTETGSFLSAGGFVISDLTLDTSTPEAMLTVTAVPEPATLLLIGAGLGAVAARRRPKPRA